MKKQETLFKEKVLKDLKKLKGAYFIKTQERGRRGVPDILGCLHGKFFALELKTETGDAMLLQTNRIQKVRAAGGFALIPTPCSWKHDFLMLKAALH